MNGWHLRTPALYALGREYAKRRVTFEVDLPLFLARKRELAFERREARRSKEESGRYLTLKMKAAPAKEPPRSFNDERRTHSTGQSSPQARRAARNRPADFNL